LGSYLLDCQALSFNLALLFWTISAIRIVQYHILYGDIDHEIVVNFGVTFRFH